MDIKELYKLWCDSAVDDSDLQRELEDIKMTTKQLTTDFTENLNSAQED